MSGVGNVGYEVTLFKEGDLVFGTTFFNGYSTELCVPEHQLLHVPEKMTLNKAAGFPVVFLTAYHALYQTAVIRAREKAIIHSAAGGVGSALLQLCKEKGLETIGVSERPTRSLMFRQWAPIM